MKTHNSPYTGEQIDEAVGAILNNDFATETYVDNKITIHNHDGKYDVKGAADEALRAAQEHVNQMIEELGDGFTDVIYEMYGDDITDNGAPTIREIANDEATTAFNNAKDLINAIDIPDEIYVGNGEMPETATIQILLDGSDEEQTLKDELKAEFNTYISMELAKRGQLKPEFANDISECIDTSKLYVLPDGYIYAYIRYTGEQLNYTNRFDSTKAKIGYRLSSSGAETEAEGYVISDYIPIDLSTKDHIVARYKNATLSSVQNGANCKVVYYDANKQLSLLNYGYNYNGGGNAKSVLVFKDENGDEYTKLGYMRTTKSDDDYSRITDPNPATFKYVRFGFIANNASDIILTFDEPIETAIVDRYVWHNTGHAFVPADYESRIVTLEHEMDETKDILLNVENSVDGVPSYVVEEADRVAMNVLSCQNENTISSLHCSDIHFSTVYNASKIGAAIQHCGQGMAQISKAVNIDFFAMHGDLFFDNRDMTPEIAVKSAKKINEYLYDASSNIDNMRMRGNHDDISYYGASPLTASQTFANSMIWNRNAIFDETNRLGGYCYRDYVKGHIKLRVISLNTAENGNIGFSMSENQCTWLGQVLADAKSKNYFALLLSHHPLDWGGFDSGIMQTISQYSDYIICNIHGHTHNFIVHNLGNTTIKGAAIPNACPERTNEYGGNSGMETSWKEYGEFESDGSTPKTYNKTVNTAQDTSFCVVTIDVNLRKIYVHCYGAGYDREISY